MFSSVGELGEKLRATGYITDSIATTTVFLAAKLHKPVLLEGPLPGFVEGFVYENTDGVSRHSVVTAAVWKNEKSFQNAKKRAAEEFQRIGFNPREIMKKLKVEIDRGIYRRSPYYSAADRCISRAGGGGIQVIDFTGTLSRPQIRNACAQTIIHQGEMRNASLASRSSSPVSAHLNTNRTIRRVAGAEQQQAEAYRYWQSLPVGARLSAVWDVSAAAYAFAAAFKGVPLHDARRPQRTITRIQRSRS